MAVDFSRAVSASATELAAEKGVTLDLTDQKVQEELKSYRSLIAQGKGAEVLY